MTTRATVHGVEVDLPFKKYGDLVTKSYKLICRNLLGEYDAPVMGTANLTDLVSAKILNLPSHAFNAAARWVGDSPRVQVNERQEQFIRTFHVIPADHIEYSTAVFTSLPVYATRRQVIRYDTVNGDPIRTKKTNFIQIPSTSSVVASEIRYSYTINPASATILTQAGFTISQADPSSYASTYFGDPVTEEYEGAITVNQTGTLNVLEGTKVEPFLGDIYRVSTVYKL